MVKNLHPALIKNHGPGQYTLQIYAEAESRANLFAMPRREQYMWTRSGQIYAEAESNANELVRFALPRRYSICGRSPNIAEAERHCRGAVVVRPDLQSGRRFLFGLMRRTQQIQNHLYRIESLQRHFHEQRIPVTHGTVPESRKLQSLQFTALIAL